MNKKKPSNCFVLLPGFSPDNYPVLELKKMLEDRGHAAVASSFYGTEIIKNLSHLTLDDCLRNLSQTIREAKKDYDRVFGIGISLGAALLLEHAKKEKNLDGIVSIGTPFKLKHQKLIRLGQVPVPLVKPFWRVAGKFKKWRLPPIAAAKVVLNFLRKDFTSDLEEIDVPTIFFHSKKDGVTDYRVVQEFSDRMKSSKKKIIFFDNVGHVINGHTEKVLEYIFEFFELPNQDR
jgi:esterase/lipase